MLIRVTRAATPVLDGVGDFKSFNLVAEDGLAGPALAAALGPAGRLEGGHAWISPAWLRAAAGGDAAWEAGFEKMLQYAAKQGWVDAAGAIRAHVERAPVQGRGAGRGPGE